MLLKKTFAEVIGTYALVFFGTGAIIINDIQGGVIGHLGIAISFGAIVLAMIKSFGDISGAHLNPAVTLSFFISGKLKFKYVPAYIAGQFAGGILASLTLLLLFPTTKTMGETLPSGTPMQSFILEFILTLILMLVIIHVSTGAKEKGITAGIAIGTTVMLEALVAGPITGASMNPARSLAPALISGNLTHLWIYLVAPTLGAIVSIGVWRLIKHKNN